MPDLVLTLVSLGVGSAIVPAPLVVTVLLLRSAKGRTATASWIGGMTFVRLVQGLIFGFVLEVAHEQEGGSGGTSPFVSGVLVALAAMFFVVAIRAFLRAPDDNAPPPKWMAMLDGIKPARAFVLGGGSLLIAPSLWVLTLAAIGAIAEAELSVPAAIGAYLVFVVLAAGVSLALLVVAYADPRRSDAALARLSDLLQRYDRQIMIVFGVALGSWLLIKGLVGIGVL